MKQKRTIERNKELFRGPMSYSGNVENMRLARNTMTQLHVILMVRLKGDWAD